jgi:hypothetical protein
MGRAPQVDVRTGAPQLQEEYARRGAGIAALGRGLFELAMTIKKQEDAAEFSELKRRVDEMGFAAFNAVTGNETADTKLLENLNQNLEGIQSTRLLGGNVNNALRQHINEIMPDWTNTIQQKGLAIRRQNVKDKFNLEAENLLGRGNLPEYYKQLHTRLALQDISQAEFDFKVANAPNDSILQQARLDVGNGRYQNAIIKLANPEFRKSLSGDQLDYAIGLSSNAEKLQTEQIREIQEQTSRTFLADFWDKKLVDPNTITNALRNGWLTTTDAEHLRNAMLNPAPTETDLKSYIKIKEALQDLSMGTKTKQEVLSFITSMTDSVSAKDGKSFIKDVYAEPDKEDTFWQREAYQTIEKRLLTTDPISGRLFGSTDQYDACDRAKIRFDDAIKSAAKTGRPLKGTDYLKKAVDIANQLAPKGSKITFGSQSKLPPSTEYEEFVIKPEAVLTPPVKYEIGQIVYQAGKQWRIAGFDTDGEPLVDEVE